MLELLEEHKVLEISLNLVHLYQDFLKSQGVDTTYQIDKKTLERTARSLEADGLASVHVVQIPLFSGSFASRTLVLHQSIGPKHKVVRDYIDQVHDRSLFTSSFAKKQLKVLPERQLEVERVDLKRKRSLPESSSLDSLSGIDSVSIYRGDESRENVDILENEEEQQEVELEGWHTISQQYGFLFPKMLRTRVFHEWLFSKMQSDPRFVTEENPCPFRNDGIFHSTMLLTEMPLELYLKVIGVTSLNAELKEFLDTADYSDFNVSNLPKSIRDTLFARRKWRFRRDVKMMVDILEFLGLVHPETSYMEEKPSTVISLQLRKRYRLTWRRIPFYDYHSDIRTLIRHYDLTSESILSDYWLQLQFTSIGPDDANLKHVDDSKDTKNPYSILQQLKTSRNWQIRFNYSLDQKKALGKYIDRESGKSVVATDAEFDIIAKAEGLSKMHLKMYFKKIEDSFQRRSTLMKQRHREARLLQMAKDQEAANTEAAASMASLMKSKRLAYNLFSNQTSRPSVVQLSHVAHARQVVRDVVSQSAGQPDTLRKMQHMPSTSALSSRHITTRVAEAEKDQERVFLEDDLTTEKEFVKSRRVAWTESESDLLIHAYAIMLNESKVNRRVMWRNIPPLFPNRGVHGCKKRIDFLVKIPHIRERIDNLVELWKVIYTEGLQSGRFSKTDEFDLKALINILKAKEQETGGFTENAGQPRNLPKNLADIQKRYSIVTDASHDAFTLEARQVEDFWRDKQTIVSKMQLLLSFPFTVRLYDQSEGDNSVISSISREEEIQEEVAQATIKVFYCRMIRGSMI